MLCRWSKPEWRQISKLLRLTYSDMKAAAKMLDKDKKGSHTPGLLLGVP
jgi:hypothetical protein